MSKPDSDADILIRQVRLEDAAVLQLLYGELQPKDPVLTEQDFARTLRVIIDQQGMKIFVLESINQVVASCYLNIIPNLTRSAAPYAVIENVVTLKSARGQGFGKRVIQHAIDAAWEAGCYKVMLMTGSKNPATHAFYRACGFNGEDKHAYIVRAPKK